MLLELVDKVLVHERDKKYSQECMQEIEIYFNFVGKFIPAGDIPEKTPKTAAILKWNLISIFSISR